MKEEVRILEIAYSIQLELAVACLTKKRLTLDQTFNILGAAMNVSDYLKKKAEQP